MDMTSLKLLLSTVAVGAVFAAAGAPAASPAVPGNGPPESVLVRLAALPTPVCTPSWGTIVLPICV
jgi:hypothetical protein